MMWRNRVVDQRLSATFQQMFLKRFSLLAQYGVYMPNVAGILQRFESLRHRQNDRRVVDGSGVQVCNLAAVGRLLIQIFEFYRQTRCLNLIQTAVHATIEVLILLVGAIVTQCSQSRCQEIVICRNSARIAQRPKILARIEAETGSIPPATRFFPVDTCAMRLRRIFENQQSAALRKVHNPWHISQSTIEMNGQDCLGSGSNCCLCFYRADIECSNVGLYQNGNKAILRYSQNTSNVGVGWNQNFIAFAKKAKLFPGSNDQFQSIKAVGNAYTMLSTAILRELFLEL
ncbi:hypothetical protein HK44_025320 [Pseudomonas fluorescens HK44]|uniref:Uncharacterized protein n=1 Tax=Pseudomonas fluorescens HK44 TaxID=1042209 RepID=A0A010TEC3_PSEFL|nr:hypothetical protein HK44_025320 [Pseudomonas fluorescens HK44]